MNQARFELIPVGWVESSLTDRASAPKQGHEGSPETWMVFEPWVMQAIEGIRAGDEVIVLMWLDRARRDVLRVHPRDDAADPEQGVFDTRSQDRPNPIGLHPVEIVSIEGNRSACATSRRWTPPRSWTSSRCSRQGHDEQEDGSGAGPRGHRQDHR